MINRSHYIEYLCSLIRQNGLESLDILKADDLETLVRRENKKLPPKPYGILESFYRQRLLEVRTEIPKNNHFLFCFLCFCFTRLMNTKKSSLDGCVNNNRWWRRFIRSHYVEYLVSVVYKANIDPLPILDLTDCVQELRRRGIQLPERGPWDTDPIYLDMCQKVIKGECFHSPFFDSSNLKHDKIQFSYFL